MLFINIYNKLCDMCLLDLFFLFIRYFVGMCGDGVNDCGVLKVVYVGIFLLEVEVFVVFLFIFK